MIIQCRVSYIWRLICELFDWFIYSFGILLFIKRSIHRLCPMGPTRALPKRPPDLGLSPPPPALSINPQPDIALCMSCAIAVHSVMSILQNRVICIKRHENCIVTFWSWNLNINYFNEFDQWWDHRGQNCEKNFE